MTITYEGDENNEAAAYNEGYAAGVEAERERHELRKWEDELPDVNGWFFADCEFIYEYPYYGPGQPRPGESDIYNKGITYINDAARSVVEGVYGVLHGPIPSPFEETQHDQT